MSRAVEIGRKAFDLGARFGSRGLSITENAIDRTIGIISPRREIVRRMDRTMAVKARQYAAAKISRLTGDWLPANQDVNSIIRSSASVLRSRTRQLTRDFPYFNRAINNLVNYSVGTGIVFQSQVKDGEGNHDKKSIRKIEDAIAWAAEEMDVAGKLHWREMERLSKRQDVESGELLFVKTFIKDSKRYIPYCLQAYEADWLTSAYAGVAQGNGIDQGIEFDPRTGRVIAYHFAVPSGYGLGLTASTKTTRVPADYVIHNFHALRPGQLRGVSPFTTAILVAHDLSDYIDAEIDGAKMAAKYLAFVSTGDPATFQGLRATTDTDTNQKIEAMENAIIEYLRPGENVTLATHNRPGDAFTPFTKFCLRMIAVSTDTTYELLTSDYDSISYSNLRGIRNDYSVMIRPHSMRHLLHVTKPVIEDIITNAVLAGKLDLPGFWKDPRHYFRGTYTPPGMESIDPLREGSAWIDQIKARLMSPQEIAAKRGRDYEEVLDEIAEAERMMNERGLAHLEISSHLQQNPAALGATEGDGKKKPAEDRHLPDDIKAALNLYGDPE